MPGFNHLSDAELLRVAHIEINTLISTGLERELIRRLEIAVVENEAIAPLMSVLMNHGVDDGPTLDTQLGFHDHYGQRGPLLDVLVEHSIDDPVALRAQLNRLEQFDLALEGLREPLHTLTTLATTE